MKTKFLLLGIMWLSISLSLFSQVTYQIRFKNNLFQRPDHMIITADGGSIVSALEPDSIKSTKVFLSKIKSNGKLAWAKAYGIENKMVTTSSIIPDTANGCIVCLRSYDLFLGNPEVFIFKTDGLGNIIWQKKVRTLTLDAGENFSGMLSASKDGGFYYIQQNSRFYTDYKGPHCSLYKFDANGNIIWNNQFNVEATTDYGTYITDITETRDKGIVMAVTTESCEAYCKTLAFIKFKADGKPEWRYGLNKYIYSYSNPIQLITTDENNNVIYVMEGNFDNRSNLYAYAVLNSKTGIARTYTFERSIFNLQHFFRKKSIDYVKGKSFKSFPGYNSQGYAFTNIYAFDNDWNLLNGSYKEYHSSENENILQEKYDKLGRICPDFTLPVINDSTAVDNLTFGKSTFHLGSAENIVIEGTNELMSSISITDPRAYCIGKMQETSTISGAIQNVIDINHFSGSIKISPNPANSILTIQGLHANNSSTVSVIDMQGRLQKQVTIKAATYQLNVSTLTRGTYILKVQDKDGNTTLKFVKQ